MRRHRRLWPSRRKIYRDSRKAGCPITDVTLEHGLDISGGEAVSSHSGALPSPRGLHRALNVARD
jgi:hypothetical protein